jgi:hypothetical protein
MILSKRAMVCVALVFALGLFSATAFGGVRDYGTPYTNGDGTWSGTTPYYLDVYGDGSEILSGRIDWIVYGKGDFPYTNSGYTPPSDQYSYVYQIVNTGTAYVSDFQFSVDEIVGNIYSFQSLGQVEGDLAGGTNYAPGLGGFVDWWFNGIGQGTTSAGLVFTSSKAPTVTTTGSVTNSGGTVGGIELPAPGPNDIPEPGTLALLVAGLGAGLLVVRRRSRC